MIQPKCIGFAILAPLFCLAQTPDSLEGSWSANFSAPNGTQREAAVLIKGDEGNWKLATARVNREDPCVGRPIPFVISKADDVFRFAMSPSKGLAGCGEDYTLSMRKVDEKTLEGNFRDGRKFVLTRR
jgi:hypothetical protein